MHAGFNSLGIRVRGVDDADDYDDDDNCNKNDRDNDSDDNGNDNDNDNDNYGGADASMPEQHATYFNNCETPVQHPPLQPQSHDRNDTGSPMARPVEQLS